MSRRMKLSAIAFLVFTLFALSGPTAMADMGPKPSITVIVRNAPEGEYYLDLLTVEPAKYKNINDTKRAAYDAAKLGLLEAYDSGGWHAGLAGGTRVPMFGKLTGDKSGRNMEHRFTYVGVPDDYKIIVVTPDNQIKVSKEIYKKVFQETVAMDYGTMAVSVASNTLAAYALQFCLTFFPTILIEGVVLLLFGFSLKRNWKVFLITNFVTQLVMSLILNQVLLKSGLLAAYLVFFPVELGIFIAETIVFTHLLQGFGRARRTAYALTANLASAVAGFLLISPGSGILK